MIAKKHPPVHLWQSCVDKWISGAQATFPSFLSCPRARSCNYLQLQQGGIENDSFMVGLKHKSLCAPICGHQLQRHAVAAVHCHRRDLIRLNQYARRQAVRTRSLTASNELGGESFASLPSSIYKQHVIAAIYGASYT